MRPTLALPALLVAITVPSLALAQERDSRAHMEACVRWVHVDGQYLTQNNGDTAVTQFMSLAGGRVIEKDVMPGSQFESGPISVSLYNCRPRARAGV